MAHPKKENRSKRSVRSKDLNWSKEFGCPDERIEKWFHAGSNMLMDFHGDPASSELVVFSDGNHNMALKEALQRFQQENRGLKNYFYVTTPPGPIVKLLKDRKLQLGNFVLSVGPHVFISPPHVLDRLVSEGFMKSHVPFVRNQGNVLLVKKGNPKNISSINDLKKDGVVVFLSNPETERVSYKGYMETLKNISNDPEFNQKINICYGTAIHHREAPEAVFRGEADAVVVFYHLALHYTRIFPDEFEIISLGGTVDNPQPCEGNLVGTTHAGIIGGGGRFGAGFLEWLSSVVVMDLYRHHGMIPL